MKIRGVKGGKQSRKRNDEDHGERRLTWSKTDRNRKGRRILMLVRFGF